MKRQNIETKDAVAEQRIIRKTATRSKAETLRRRFAELDNSWRLADAEGRALERRKRSAKAVMNDEREYVAWVHPDGTRITPRQLERVQVKAAAAFEDRNRAESAMRAAEVEADRADRSLADWLVNKQYWANQREQESALSPEERERRELRARLAALEVTK